MDLVVNRSFGQIITRLINGENLTEDDSHRAFCLVLNNEVTDMQQGAFLAALSAKGETAAEVAGGWRAIYELDTTKVDLSGDESVVDNCGTGMDTFKTFNISTGSSLIAAAGGVKVARHGARAITSTCGTVDMAETLGVDVECDVSLVADSISKAGVGLFNGMSPKVHPMALGRILSQISFGSPLNIAASLANPALPKIALRGVYSKDLVMPVAHVMQAIGYTDALVVYGTITGSDKGMDEASVCGTTFGARLCDGSIEEISIIPEDVGLTTHKPDELAPGESRESEAQRMIRLLRGSENGARRDVLLLNSGLLFNLTGKAATIGEGVSMAADCIDQGAAIDALTNWVTHQNAQPDKGLAKLETLMAKAG